MRRMKPFYTDETTGEAKEIPVISAGEWWQKLEAIAGRPLTDDERARADKMANHGWLLRVVATELFGEAKTDAHFSR